jgi:peptidoglycan/LPS O-acetylase OafA/YrhL
MAEGRVRASVRAGDLAIPSLDGLRAVAVAIVVAAHLGLRQWIPGEFGVTVFFFLSGFLITTLLRVEFERTGRISLRRFYLRRVLRLLPPFYLVLGLASLLTLVGVIGGQTLRLDAVLPQILYMSNYQVVQTGWWVGRAPGTAIYWSLAVEEHFYLVFPVLYLLLRHRLPPPRRQLAVLLGICAAVLAWRCVLVFALHAGNDRTYVATDARMDSLLFGCALAVYGNPVLDRDAATPRRWRELWLPVGVAGLLLSFLIRDPHFQQSVRYTLQGAALVPLFVVAMRWHDWGVLRLLNLWWVRLLGVLSYVIYLVHLTVFYALGDQRLPLRSPGLRAALAVLLTLAIALTIHHLVERPCARLRRRLSSGGARCEGAADGGAGSRQAGDLELATEENGALLHPEDPGARGGQRRGQVGAVPVIAHRQRQPLLLRVEADHDALRPAVQRDVAQGLLDDPAEVARDLGGEAARPRR